jgi:beta-glucosidase
VSELKGFQRITLEPGKSQDVEFILPTDALAFHNRDMRLVTAASRVYRVWVSGDSAGGQPVEFEIE